MDSPLSSRKSKDVETPEDVPFNLHTLSILGLTYIIQHHEGAWWKGCCFRPKIVKAILRNISLHVQSGELTGILGNSGSGKTTLLDLMSCRANGQVVGGIYLDGKLMTADIFQTLAGYVMQADRLLPNLTVRETLTYVARLKFSLASKKAIKDRVDQVLSDMDLTHISNSLVGGLISRGISGGEKRRLTIGVQLLQDPKLLLLDEPTTGLDSFTSHYLMRTLAKLAKTQNKIIITTIHQPRSDIFWMFDNIALLSRGDMVYFGPSHSMVSHFTSLGHPCPTYVNPLDYYLDLASVDYRSAKHEKNSQIRLDSLRNGFFHSATFKNTLTDIHSTCHFLDRVETFESNPLGVPAPPGYIMTMGTLVTRMMINLSRDRIAFLSRIFYMNTFCIFLFLFLFQLKTNASSIQDRVGLLYQSGQTPAYCGMLMAATLFPPMRDLYYREYRDGLYGPMVFLNSYFVFTLPLAAACSLVFATCNYWILHMYPEPHRYGIYFTVVFLMHYGGELLMIIFLGVIRKVNVANSLTSLILALTGLLSSGFLRSISDMAKPIQILAFGTIFKYSSEIFVVNEFEDLEFDCASQNTSEVCLVPNGNVLVAYLYPGSVDNFNRNFWILSSFVFGYAVLAIITYRVIGIKQMH